MPQFLATYDLTNTTPSPYTEFRDQAIKLGWQVWILSSSDTWFRLPNTTLVGNFATQDQAVIALKNARANTERALGRTVTMEKWIVAQYTESKFSSDQTSPKK